MNDRKTEYKLALDHAIVAALKFARLTGQDVTVAFHENGLVLMPRASLRQGIVAVVRPTSTAAELKAQVAQYLLEEEKRMRAPFEVVDASTQLTQTATQDDYMLKFLVQVLGLSADEARDLINRSIDARMERLLLEEHGGRFN